MRQPGLIVIPYRHTRPDRASDTVNQKYNRKRVTGIASSHPSKISEFFIKTRDFKARDDVKYHSNLTVMRILTRSKTQKSPFLWKITCARDGHDGPFRHGFHRGSGCRSVPAVLLCLR